jgi:hypothetical protein
MWLWPKFVPVLGPRVTCLPPMRDFVRFSISSKPSDFCMWNFVSADTCKAQLALSADTKFQIQKCNTCRDIEKQNRRIRFLQWCSKRPIAELMNSDGPPPLWSGSTLQGELLFTAHAAPWSNKLAINLEILVISTRVYTSIVIYLFFHNTY